MSAPLILDTCACIFIVNGALSVSADRFLLEHYRGNGVVYVSPITAWEIGSLIRKGRLRTTLNARAYFAAVTGVGRTTVADMPTDVLIDSWVMPGNPPKDPADRIIAATARAYGYTVMTRDQLLLDYAAQGHLSAVPC